MDALDRLEVERERRRALFAPAAPPKPRTDMPLAAYPVTLIGCIRGADGWYQAGFDEQKKTIIPLNHIP